MSAERLIKARAILQGADLPHGRYTDALLFAALSLLALALRCAGILHHGLSMDEPFTVWYAQMPLGEIRTQLWGGNSPPAFEMLVHLWTSCFGDSVLAHRMLPALAGALTAGMIYLCGREVFSARTGVLAALLFAAGERQIFYAHETRGYTLLLLFTMLCCWMLLSWMKEAHWKWLLLTIPVAVAMIYVHYFGLLVLGILCLSAWVGAPAPRLKNRLVLPGVFLGIILLCAPLFTGLFTGASKATAEHWVPEAGLSNLVFAASRLLNSLTMAILALAVMLGAIARWLIQKESRRLTHARGLIMLLSLFPVTYLVFWMAGRFIPVFLGRYILFTSGALILLTAAALGYCFRGRWRTLAEVVYLIAFCVSTNLWPRHNDNWPEVAAVMASHTGKGGAVLFVPGWGYLGPAYYLDRDAFRDYAHTFDRIQARHVYPYLASAHTPFDAAEWNNILIVRNGSFKTELSDSLNQILSREFRVDSVTQPYHSVEFSWLSRTPPGDSLR